MPYEPSHDLRCPECNGRGYCGYYIHFEWDGEEIRRSGESTPVPCADCGGSGFMREEAKPDVSGVLPGEEE